MKLHEIVALEKGAKGRAQSELTELLRKNQKPDLFEGFVKRYKPLNEGGETLPDEEKRVQLKASEQLASMKSILNPLFEILGKKECTNQSAKADIVVDGIELLSDVPVPMLLFLEKQCQNFRSVIGALPTLASSESWEWNGASHLHETESVETNRTKKEQRPLVMYDATDKHPAQTQLITEDVVVGRYGLVKKSGALPESRKKELLNRVDKLEAAVKTARQRANNETVVDALDTDAILNYILQ